MDIAAALQAAHVSVAEADRVQARRDEQRTGTAASGLPHYSPHAGAVVVPVVPPAPRSAAAVPAARAPVRRLAPAAASFGSAVPHPLQALVAALPASAARPSLHGPNGGGSGGGAGGALHKCSDPFYLALLLEEARLALQYGKHVQALTIYQLLIDQGHSPQVPNLHFFVAVCRREAGHDLAAINSLAAQLKLNEAQGLHAIRNSGLSNPIAEHSSSATSSSASLLAGMGAVDPDVIAPSIACELERLAAWESLHETEQARKSTKALRRLIDLTAAVPALSDQAYPCFLAAAKWLAAQGLDDRARSALERALDAVRVEDPSVDAVVNDPHWLLLACYVEWNLGEYERVELYALHLLRAPSSILAPMNAASGSGASAAASAVAAMEAERLLDDARDKAALFLAASSSSAASASASPDFPAASLPPTSFEAALRGLDDLLAPSGSGSGGMSRRSPSLEVQHAALVLKSNIALLRGLLPGAIDSLRRAVALEARMEQEARQRIQAALGHLGAGAGLVALQPQPPRFPFFGPASWVPPPPSASPSQGNIPPAPILPPVSLVNMYDLSRTMESWTMRAARPAPGAGGGAPPNFEVLLACGGANPAHYSSRSLSVLLDLYSDLLLKLGPVDPRLAWYRAGVWGCLGNRRMQLHDLEVLAATAPGEWLPQYVRNQTSCDLPSLHSRACPAVAGRGCFLSALHAHLCASAWAAMLDRNVRTSLGNLAAVQKKMYECLARIPVQPRADAQAVAASTTPSPLTNQRRLGPSNSHRRDPSSTASLSSRASTAHSAVRLGHGGGGGGGSTGFGPGSLPTPEQEHVPTGGLLECEDALYIDAVVADLTRQHAACALASNPTAQNAAFNRAQDAFEALLKQATTLAAAATIAPPQPHVPAPVATSTAVAASALVTTPAAAGPVMPAAAAPAVSPAAVSAAPTPSGPSGFLLATLLLCTEGLALIYHYRLRFAATRHTIMDGLLVVWSAVDRLLESRPASTRRTALSGLPGGALVASTAPFHIKALKLSAPLLALIDEEGTVSPASVSAPDAFSPSPSPAASSAAAPQSWLSPARVHLASLQGHCASLVALLGASFALEGDTDTSLLLLYRSLALDAQGHFAHLNLFLHHWRLSPVALAARHFSQLLQHVPFFVPNLEAVCLSPVRYPLALDAGFGGGVGGGGSAGGPSGSSTAAPSPRSSSDGTSAVASATASYNPFDGDPASSPRSGRPIADPSTLGFPFPPAAVRCLTSRITDRPYVHSGSAEVNAYLASLSSHAHAVRARNQLQMQAQRQHDVVDKIKAEAALGPSVANAPVRLSSLKGLDAESAAAVGLIHASCSEPSVAAAAAAGATVVPLILSLSTLHPAHVLHPVQQRNRFKLEGAGAGAEYGFSAGMDAFDPDDRSKASALASSAALKPNKPSTANPKGAPSGRGSKTTTSGKKSGAGGSNANSTGSGSGSGSGGGGSAGGGGGAGGGSMTSDAKGLSFNLSDPTAPRTLPPFLHVEHRAYQPPAAALAGPASSANGAAGVGAGSGVGAAGSASNSGTGGPSASPGTSSSGGGGGGGPGWSASTWHKEAQKLLSHHDKNGCMLALGKCLRLDRDHCAPLNYLLSLLETSTSPGVAAHQAARKRREWREIERLEAAASAAAAAATGGRAPSPSASTSASAPSPVPIGGGGGGGGMVPKHSPDSLAALFGREKVLPIAWDLFTRAKAFEEQLGHGELALAEYSYALKFQPGLGDALWRRALLFRARGNVPAALVDVSAAIECARSDQAHLERIPGAAAAATAAAAAASQQPGGPGGSGSSTGRKLPGPVLEEIKPHMSEREKRDLAASNALRAAAHSAPASLLIVRQKLEYYHLVRAVLVFQQAGGEAHAIAHATERHESQGQGQGQAHAPSQAPSKADSKFHSAALDAQECLRLNPRNPLALRLLSLAHTRLRHYSEAVRALERYLDLVPRDHGSRLRLANLLSYTAQFDRAAPHFQRLLAAAPGNAQVLYGKALSYFRQHMWHEAHEALQGCIGAAPRFWRAYLRMGEVLERMESLDLAIQTIKIAMAGAAAAAAAAAAATSSSSSASRSPRSSHADDPWSSPLSGDSLGAAPSLGEGEGHTDLEAFPLDYAHRTLGRVYLSQAQRAYMAYLAAQEEERKAGAKRTRERHMRGTSFAQPGLARTTELAAAGLGGGPSSPGGGGGEPSTSPLPSPRTRANNLWDEAVSSATSEVRNQRAAESAHAARMRDGLFSAEDAAAAAAGASTAASSAAAAARKKSVEYVSKCLHMSLHSLSLSIQSPLGQQDPESHYLLAVALLFLAGNRSPDPGAGPGPGGMVWTLLGRVVALQEGHAEARFLRGFLLQRLGRPEQAAEELDRCLALEPEHVLALQARAYIHFGRHEHHKASELYTRILSQPGPLRPAAYANRGLVQMLQGAHHLALQDLGHAVAASPSLALAWLYRAECHKALGFTSEAVADYRAAVPLLKQKLDDAEAERKLIEPPQIKSKRTVTAAAAATAAGGGSVAQQRTQAGASSSAFSFSGGAALARPPSNTMSSRASSLYTRDGEFGTPAMSPAMSPATHDPAAAVAGATGEAPHHIRGASSGSISLTLPAGLGLGSGPPAQASSAPGPGPGLSSHAHTAHVRRPAAALWRSVQDLVQSGSFRRALTSTPAQQSSAGSTSLGLGLGLGAPSAQDAALRPATAERDRAAATASTAIDLDSLHLPVIHGPEHLRLTGTLAAATSFQSEVGLESRDLDAIHNSLGILLHRRAEAKRRALLLAGKSSSLAHVALASAAAPGQGGSGPPSPLSSTTPAPGPPSATSSALSIAAQEGEEALSYFSASSTQFEAHYNRGLIFLQRGEVHAALLEFKQVVHAAPHFANGHIGYGVVMEKTGQVDLAASHYTRALQLTHSKNLVAAFNLANTKVRTQQYQDAVRLYTIFLKRCAALRRSEAKKGAAGGGAAVAAQQHAAAVAVASAKSKGSLTAGGGSGSGDASFAQYGADAGGEDVESWSGGFARGPKRPEELRPFEQGMIEHLEKEAAATAAASPRLTAPASATAAVAASATGAKGIGSRASAAASPDALPPFHPGGGDSSLWSLVPLALNNRAICYQNLGANDAALRGYTAALRLAPHLSYVKFNRAHLYMLVGNCFDALEDIRDYAREQSARGFHSSEGAGAASSEGRRLAAGMGALNAVERELLQPQASPMQIGGGGSGEGAAGGGASGGVSVGVGVGGTTPPSPSPQAAATSSSLSPGGDQGGGTGTGPSLEYLQSFSDYCHRYQWGLAVASKDMLRGIRVLPILCNLNTNVAANPLVLFNPHMLPRSEGKDWRRLRGLLAAMEGTGVANVRTELEQMALGSAAAAAAAAAADEKLGAVLASSPFDSPFVAHVKLALRHQVYQQYGPCLDALLKAIYLLPQPSQQQQQQQPQQHGLGSSSPLGAPATSAAEAAVHADLVGEMHEVLILWRARLQVYLSQYDGAVADLEFYTHSTLGHSGAGDAAGVGGGVGGRKRARLAALSDLGGLDDIDGADVHDNGTLDDLLAVSFGLGDALAAAGIQATPSSRSHSRLGASGAGAGSSGGSGGGAAPAGGAGGSVGAVGSSGAGATPSEQALLHQQALFAHRAAVRHSRLLCYLGSLYHMRRRDADAVRVYSAALAIEPNNFYAALNRALVHRLQGRFSNAIADLFEVVRVLKLLDEQQRAKNRAARPPRHNNAVAVATAAVADALLTSANATANTNASAGTSGTSGSGSGSDGSVGGGGGGGSLSDADSPVAAPSAFQPEIDTGLPQPPVVQFSPAQQVVYTVLHRYADTLKKNPQEHWDSITAIQGQLAIAVDAALAERKEMQQKRLPVPNLLLPLASRAAGVAVDGDVSASSAFGTAADEAEDGSSKLSAAESAARFRDQLDSAADNLMQHLIDPKSAREHSARAASAHATAAAASSSSATTSKPKAQSTLAESNAPVAASSSTSSAQSAGASLDLSFEQAFANMQALIHSQLPKKMLAGSPMGGGATSATSIGADQPSMAASSSSFSFNPLAAPLIVGSASTASSLSIAAPSAAAAANAKAAAPAVPSTQFNNLMSGLRERARTEAAEAAALALAQASQQHNSSSSSIATSASSAPISARGAVPPSGARKATAAGGRRGRAGAAAANASGSGTFKGSSARSSAAASAVTTPTARNGSGGGGAGGIVGMDQSESRFEASLDPTLSPGSRTRLQEEHRLARIAAVRAKFGTGRHGRADSFYGFLDRAAAPAEDGAAGSVGLSPNSSLAALHARNQHQLRNIQLAELEEQEADMDDWNELEDDEEQ